MPTDSPDPELLKRAEQWIAGDPDPETRSSLKSALEERDFQELRAAVGTTLTFGTAGIRGEVGPGSGRMNQAMVILTTAGLVNHLRHDGRDDKPVVLGFDARPTSRRFAELAAGVLAANGLRVVYFDQVTPTPIVAFAARHLKAGAAIVITASHNPPADNGYKVYGANAAQIIPPEDEQIAAQIDEAGPANEISMLDEAFTKAHPAISRATDDLVVAYFSEVADSRPDPQTSDLKFAYTAMHGVGGRFVSRLFSTAGHVGLTPVPEQFEPDGRFPTVVFPNPEEEGALDLGLALAGSIGAEALIANDPDADRLAACVRRGGDFRPLSGNELGALLGDYVLANWSHSETPIVANSIVSSPILARIAAQYGAHHEATLTGFKWIINAVLAVEDSGGGRFAFGFEEALGYSVGRTVRDKDGISAALIFADLVASEAAIGNSVVDRLHAIWRRVGLWVSTQYSIVRSGPSGTQEIERSLASLGDKPPAQLGDHAVTKVIDYRTGYEQRPPWLGAQSLIELWIGDSGRVLARPSGTEPKLKIYVDLSGDAGADPDDNHSRLQERAKLLAVEVQQLLGLD